jgi:plastocyanin
MKSFVNIFRFLLCLCLLDGGIALAQAAVSAGVEVTREGAEKASADQANVAVWLTPVSPSVQAVEATKAAERKYVLNQRDKNFSPHLLLVPVGAAVSFPNHDPVFHNVFSLFEGKRFDLGLYEAGTSRTIRFDRPGVSYIFCNIHPEMGAVVIALRTPFYGTSDRAGKVSIPAVPAGRYVMHVWHEAASPEALNALRREVTISNEPHSLGTIRLQLPPAQNVAHKNKYGLDYPRPRGELYEQR